MEAKVKIDEYKKESSLSKGKIALSARL